MFRLIANVLAILSLSLPAGRAIPAETSESFRDAASTDQNFRPVGAHLTLGAALQIAEAFARQSSGLASLMASNLRRLSKCRALTASL
jgi:hypothetical protein